MTSERVQPRFFKRLVSLLLGVALALPVCAAAWPGGLVRLGVPVATSPPATGWQRLFVELEQPSVAAYRAARLARGVSSDRAAQRRYAADIATAQQRLLPTIARQVRSVDGRFRIAVNGFRVTATLRQAAALTKLPGVASVRRFALHAPELNASVPWIGAPSLWTDGDGSGVTVAVVDTGIDYTHAAFGGSGDTLDFLLNDPAEIETGTFPTEKVIGGWDFAGPLYDARDEGTVPEPDPDPIDRHGHGTHVAGIVAGAALGPHLGSGVAPGASLLALKVFSDEGGSTDLVTDAIEMALDPDGDGAMDDRVDVINMSLGATFGDPADPSAIAAANAVRNGVIVVASAGNRADAPYVTGAPAVAPEVISVAASLPGNRTLAAIGIDSDDVTVAGRHEAREGLGPVSIAAAPVRAALVTIQSPADGGDGAPLPAKDDMGCHPALNSVELQGRIALVRRGNCSFATKYLNAQDAGAAAIVVFNDGVSSSRMGPQTMTGLDDSAIAIPGVMISFPSGEALLASLRARFDASAELHPSVTVPADPAEDDTLASFTSSGPGHGGSLFKPDLAAPGRGIVSADAGSGFDAIARSGTSMAAPHVAGAAALLRQRFPGLMPETIKALLQNAVVRANRDGPGTDSPYALSRQGTGIVRLDLAATLPAHAQPGGVSFGRVNAIVDVTQRRPVTLVNRDETTRDYTVHHEPGRTQRGVTVTCPADVTLPAGERIDVELVLDARPGEMFHDRGGDTQTEVDGWCVFAGEDHTLRVGYLAVVDPASALRAVADDTGAVLVNEGPARGFAEMFTLAHRASPIAPANDAAVAALGFRATDYSGFPLMQLAIAMRTGWESPSHLSFEMWVDNDEDGRDDWLLVIADWSELGGSPGSMITAQYPLDAAGQPDEEAGYLDWIFSSVDYNDQVMIVPFTLISPGGAVFLPPRDSNFNYRLVATTREGAQDIHSGSIDLEETAPGSDDTLWLDGAAEAVLPDSSWPALLVYPNNRLGRQFQAVGPTARESLSPQRRNTPARRAADRR